MRESAQRRDEARAAEVVVDQGMRRWYDSCPCCLSSTYPEVKRTLDLERSGLRGKTGGHG
ncbi:MAG: hypothetical protein M0T72_12420 [Candidatus Dormibacteraeota bacterium]|nr:hypothetical protein [Candidatus Dormibacteraeota bacterium]